MELEDETLQIAAVGCRETELIVTLKDGRRIAAPLRWLPRLRSATPAQRANRDIVPFGHAIEWPELDERMIVKGACAAASRPRARRRLEQSGASQLVRSP